jgi:hypothetical protein
MYENKYDFFESKPLTILQRNQRKIQNMENRKNPLKKPSYYEYREQ